MTLVGDDHFTQMRRETGIFGEEDQLQSRQKRNYLDRVTSIEKETTLICTKPN